MIFYLRCSDRYFDYLKERKKELDIETEELKKQTKKDEEELKELQESTASFKKGLEELKSLPHNYWKLKREELETLQKQKKEEALKKKATENQKQIYIHEPKEKEINHNDQKKTSLTTIFIFIFGCVLVGGLSFGIWKFRQKNTKNKS